MKKTRSDKEQLLLETLARMQEEKASLSVRVESLIAQLAAARESYKEETESLRSHYAEEMERQRRQHAEEMESLRKSLEASYSREVESLKASLETVRRTMDDMARANASMAKELSNALASGKRWQGKSFGRSSEQRDLLNNRNADARAMEKDGFDGEDNGDRGDAPGGDAEGGGNSPETKEKKKSKGRQPSKEDYECDEVVRHPLDEYFRLPEGASFKTRNGAPEIHEIEYYEFIPGRIVKHVYETASYVDADGEVRNTLPRAERPTPVQGCPFTPEMLAFLFAEKHAYHTPKNRIIKKLRDMGAKFSRSSFVRYYQLGEKALRDFLWPTFHSAAMDCDYLMIDETCELVGVDDKETGGRSYLKRYLWAFYNRAAGLVSYVYEQGSRAREVVLSALQRFQGSFTSDGYAAYKAFDGDDHPGILHCGCWTHVRRKVIEMLAVASELGYRFLDDIHLLFHYEREFKSLDPKEREARRQRLSLPVMNRIFAMARSVASDTALMGMELVKKAVTYMLTQEQSLRNFIFDGSVQISNNECEQRMKPIKLDLKNCQNIGSEAAAENSAFMHSIIESCRINLKNPYEYLLALFRCLRKDMDDGAKRALVPDLWAPEC